MAKKKARQRKAMAIQHNTRHSASLGVPQAVADAFMALYNAQQFEKAREAAQAMVSLYPESAFAWKALGTACIENNLAGEALRPLEQALALDPNDALTLTSLASACYRLGDFQNAVKYQQKSVDIKPDYAHGQYNLAEVLQSAGRLIEALDHAKKAQQLGFNEFRCLVLIGALQYQTKFFSDAFSLYKKLERDFPPHYAVYNNLGNLYKDIGNYQQAEKYYQKSLAVNPDYVTAYSNIFYAKHYNPAVKQAEIIEFAKQWDQKFSLESLSTADYLKDSAKPLRVGLISSGFRLHPVGQMIASALEESRSDFLFYGYTTNDQADFITENIRSACQVWRSIRHLSQRDIAHQIRNDQIEILIDLSGHGDGSCLQAISMRPAPLCIKWVGGLVNTMGLESIDYLLSDSIETPEGIDDQYTEKLIRLPDDYICYVPCAYAPSTTALPAIKNRYITLGCLNNPAKISSELLSEWAVLMHQLTESRLLMRGPQYESQDFCRRIWDEMAEHGIAQERVLLEGPAKHKEFLETYQRIDIALDTWPYSGGLTTCEALLMGVPVVTLPGPTFAGRHSATHLINAGLPELVTNSWDEYRQRVVELANDLPNLAVIRAGLRTILHYSPVCDAPRFANHFNNALRAIWVRYCDDKAPEALTFNKEGEMWFADEDKLVELPDVVSEEVDENEPFEWKFDEPIIIVDNAAVLPRHPDYPKWMASGHLAVISFDPASLLNKKIDELKKFGELHHYPHALLGDGQPATLYATLDAEKSSTLKPLPEDQLPEYQRDKLKILAELPVNTVALDNIEGLSSVDMLVLDDLHDAVKVLENGGNYLKETLLIQVKVAFQPTHERQPNLAELQHWASRNGFRFYTLQNLLCHSHFPENISDGHYQASELVSVSALFLPSYQRMASLSRDHKIKIAFFLDAIYEVRDLSYSLLSEISLDYADLYIKDDLEVKKTPLQEQFSSVQNIAKYLELSSLKVNAVQHQLPGHLVVSLTSYKPRFEDLHLTLRSLLLQDTAPDILILWIAETEREKLPPSVWELEQHGLDIRFCEDIRSYKKIIPTLREFPDSFIVTADDDLFYESNWLKNLVESWDGNMKTVVAHRAHKIVLNARKEPVSYQKWKWQVDFNEPANGLIFSTSGAGALWPPHVFHDDISSEKKFLKLCPDADDIWLYWMSSLKGAVVKRSNYNFIFTEWPISLASPLWHTNVLGNGNDLQVRNMVKEYGFPNVLFKDGCQSAFSVGGYWENRYLHCGTSGAGSYGRLAIFKSEIINEFIVNNGIESVIEFGCGDGNQLSLMVSEVDYLGLDVSETAVKICQEKFSIDSNKRFAILDDFKRHPELAVMTMSLDVIYHLVDDGIFHDYMEILFLCSKEYCVIYSANVDEKTADPHVKKRKFSNWIDKYAPEWELEEFMPNRYPMRAGSDPNNTSFADFFIYKKR